MQCIVRRVDVTVVGTVSMVTGRDMSGSELGTGRDMSGSELGTTSELDFIVKQYFIFIKLHVSALIGHQQAPWSKVLEKLTVPQPVKKFPAFYVTRRFITALTTSRHLSLS
jgi:hypothetical protein